MARTWTDPRTQETWELDIDWIEGSPYGFSQGGESRGRMIFRGEDEEYWAETFILPSQLEELPLSLIQRLFDLVRKRAEERESPGAGKPQTESD